jgi:two-component system, LuxR family, response regulator FixJ
VTTLNIYVVDDDEGVRSSLYSLLSTTANLIIQGFRSGDAFLQKASGYDRGVVLLDYDMPGASGLDVLRAINSARWPLLAIILTGQGNVGLAVKAMKAGAFDFIEKPCDPALLFDAVNRAFGKLESDGAPVARIENAKAKISLLSGRETEVLLGLIEGHSNKVIAHSLDLSPRTVEIYRANIMDKLEVRSLPEALRIAFSAGIFPLD